jgi:[acyl-carrier-protein] S-malonyltransferase
MKGLDPIMTLAFIIDGGLNDPPGTGIDMYESFPSVREVYAQAARCCGMPVDRLLSWELDRCGEHRQVGAIRQTALALGLCDVLEGHGVRPDVVAGMSHGAITGAAVTGAVARQELFGLLAHLRGVPDPTGPPHGCASFFLPRERDPGEFVGGFPDGVYIAAEMGVADQNPAVQMVLLSGYRAALDQLASQLPERCELHIPPDINTAYHSPLLRHVTDFAEPWVARMTFRDPQIPLCGALAPFEYETGEQVRSMILRNSTDPVILPRLFECLDRHEVKLSLVLGPSMGDLLVTAAKHTIVCVESPEHIPEALEAVYESGLTVRH